MLGYNFASLFWTPVDRAMLNFTRLNSSLLGYNFALLG